MDLIDCDPHSLLFRISEAAGRDQWKCNGPYPISCCQCKTPSIAGPQKLFLSMFPVDEPRTDSMNNIFCRKPKSRSDESFSHFRRTDIFPAPGKKLLIARRFVDCSITAVSDCRHTICRIDNGLCGHLRDVITNYLKWHFSSSLQDFNLSALLYHK